MIGFQSKGHHEPLCVHPKNNHTQCCIQDKSLQEVDLVQLQYYSKSAQWLLVQLHPLARHLKKVASWLLNKSYGQDATKVAAHNQNYKEEEQEEKREWERGKRCTLEGDRLEEKLFKGRRKREITKGEREKAKRSNFEVDEEPPMKATETSNARRRMMQDKLAIRGIVAHESPKWYSRWCWSRETKNKKTKEEEEDDDDDDDDHDDDETTVDGVCGCFEIFMFPNPSHTLK